MDWTVTAADQVFHCIIGTVRGVDEEGRPLVAWAGCEVGPKPALVVWMPHMPGWATITGARILLGFIDGDLEKPIITGLLDSPQLQSSPKPPSGPGLAESLPLSSVKSIEGENEIVLKCGKASISLRADGRIVIKGGYLLSRSTGLNKVQGASIQLN